MCNETGIPELMVVIVTSRARSLCNPTQQDFINTRTLPIYKCHTCFKPEYTMQYSVQPARNTKNEVHAHLLGNA